MRTRRLIGILIGLQAAAAIGYVAIARERSHGGRFDFDAIDEEAPHLELERADGSRFRLADLRGRRVLLHFWATWCPPCREELPVLGALAEEMDDQGITVLAVALDPEWESIRRFTRELPPMIVRSAEASAVADFGLSTLPDTFVLDAEGRMTARIRGARDWRSAGARQIFDR